MRNALSVLFFVFLFIAPAPAQNLKALTLSTAIELALEKNLSVIEAQTGVQSYQSVERAAYGNLLPSLDLSGGFSRRQTWSTQQGYVIIQGVPIPTGGSALSTNNSYSTGLSSQVTLFNGFANTSNVKRAESNTNGAAFSMKRTQQSIINQTNQLFLNLFRTYRLMKVSEDNLKRSQQQLEQIDEKNKVGAVALADVYRQRVQVGSDELSLIQAQNNHEKAKADLLSFLGVNFDLEYTFDFSGIPADIDTAEFVQVNKEYSDFNALINQAVSNRPDYHASMEKYNAADASVAYARGGHYPSVTAQASYGYNSSELDHLSDNKNLYFGFNVSVPIFSGFSIQSQVEQAEVQKINTEQEMNQSRRQITVDIRKGLLDLEAAEKEIAVTKASVLSAEMDRQIAQEKYNLGSGTLLDLLIGNANYTTALSNKVNAVVDYLNARKQMEFALGVISK